MINLIAFSGSYGSKRPMKEVVWEMVKLNIFLMVLAAVTLCIFRVSK